MSAYRLGEEKRRFEVHVHHGVPVGFGEIDRVIAANNARVVDQDVELTAFVQGLFDYSRYYAGIGQIGMYG